MYDRQVNIPNIKKICGGFVGYVFLHAPYLEIIARACDGNVIEDEGVRIVLDDAE